jgi:seryl-tRNA(Sec) selenium transferase
LVSSKLVQCPPIDLTKAVAVAHSHGIPTIIDGAAQDFRIRELVATNADLILISAQKYLASPTAGLVIGQRALVDSVRAQEKGIGRGMKATKESIVGVLAAIEEREKLNLYQWQRLQDQKITDFVERANTFSGVKARTEQDPTGLPFSRVQMKIDSNETSLNARLLANKLRSGSPSIWVMDQNAEEGEIGLELVQATKNEIEAIFSRLSLLLD